MKKLLPPALFMLLVLYSGFAQEEPPSPTSLITDNAGILPPAEEAELQPLLEELYDTNTAQFAVVTVPSLEGRDIEGYAFTLAEGTLGDAATNNGLLLLIALEEQQYRFEVGRGLEPLLPDIIMGRIGREHLVPNFQQGNYGQGVLEATAAIRSILLNDTAAIQHYSQEQDPPRGPQLALVAFIILSIIILSIVISIKQRKHGRKTNDSDYFLAAMVLSQMLGGGRRGGGFGGSGGGFGGFGGGGFGGGGASGGW